ncbi:MAG: TatD related DNase [Methanoregula sp. PtaU1.Bin051]|nr:MAG: TatD related DNase [Methanoregula sp. PtaU1.Bin051]
MRSPRFPITDDHIHIDPRNGRGIDAAKDFQRAGGTHLFLVSKPSSSFGIGPESGQDYAPVFDETIRVAGLVRETGLVVFPVLGVHPAEISRMAERVGITHAAEVMKAGLDLAAKHVTEGKAVALKSGRPHYEVTAEVLAASNGILSHALSLARDCGCALQIHAEGGPCADVVEMAQKAGIPTERVVKHYATPDTSLTPSFIAKHEAIPALCREGRAFMMESDYMDENSRPGAVIGPKSVPRITKHLLEQGAITMEDCHRIHVATVEKVYGVEITLP